MGSTFTAVYLPKLNKPDVIEELSYESILSEMLADLAVRDETLVIDEHDPSYKLLEVAAYRELLIRKRVNAAGTSIMLAYASGNNLDNLGALPWINLERLVIVPGDDSTYPPTDPIYESDEAFRKRMQLSLEGFSTAGPEGAYIFHAMSADGRVKDAAAQAPKFSYANLDPSVEAQLPPGVIVLQVDDDAGLDEPMPGDVVVTAMSSENDGAAPSDLVNTIQVALTDEDVVPLTDHVIVKSVNVINYSIEATLYLFSGPGGDEVVAQAEYAINEYIKNQHKIGLDITLSGIYAALHQPGVQRVELASPVADIVVDRQSTAFCTSVIVIKGDLDE